jgi:hypothetical protein
VKEGRVSSDEGSSRTAIHEEKITVVNLCALHRDAKVLTGFGGAGVVEIVTD